MDERIIRPKSALTLSYVSGYASPFSDIANTADTNTKLKTTGGTVTQMYVARMFTAPASGKIESAVLTLGRTGSPAGTTRLRILANTGDLPDYKIGGDSGPITSADLSADAGGADQTFTWTDDFPELVAGSVYWVAIIPKDFVYLENVTEIRFRTDADGATGESEIARYIEGVQPKWSVLSANVGANLVVNYKTQIITMGTKTKIKVGVDFTIGSSSGLSIKVEVSNDRVTWHTAPAQLIGESQTVIKDNEIIYESTGVPSFEVAINNPYARISVKAIDVLTDALVGITVWRY